MPTPGDTPPRRVPRRSAGLAAFLGWVVPGLGQVYVNRPMKGLWFFGLIVGTYALGLWLAGFTCVDPDREPLWFAGQVLAGGPTAAAWWWTRGLLATSRLATYDVGLLYVTVASLLNVVAIADALGTVDEYAQARAEQDRLRREAEARELAAAQLLRDAILRDEAAATAGAPAALHFDAVGNVSASPPEAPSPLGSPNEPGGAFDDLRRGLVSPEWAIGETGPPSSARDGGAHDGPGPDGRPSTLRGSAS